MAMRGLAAALLISSSFAVAAHADPAGERLVRTFIDTIDKSPEWRASAAKIASQDSATIVEDLKIAREHGGLAAEFGKLTLDGLAERGGGGISLPVFAVMAARLTGEHWSYTIPQLSGKGLVTPSLAGWAFDPKAPVTTLAGLYTRLAQTEFTEIAVPSAALAQSVELPGSGKRSSMTATYAGLKFGALSNGILTAQTLDRMEQTSSAEGLSITQIMDGLEAKSMNLGALARVFDPASYAGGKGDGTWIDAFAGGSYRRIAVATGGKEVFTAGPLTFGRMQVRQTSEPITPAIDALIAMDSPPNEAAAMALLETHAANFLGWFRISSVSLKNIVGSPPGGGAVKLAEIAFEDASAEGLKRMSLTGLDADGPQFKASLKSFEIGDIVWPSIKSFIVIGKLEESKKSGSPSPELLAEAVESFLGFIPKIGHISISGFAAGLPGGEPLTLDNYEATMSGKYALLPEQTTARLKNLVIPHGLLAASPESAEVFAALGYDRLVLHVTGDGSYREAAGRYATSSKIAVDDAGSLEIAYAIGALTPERIKQLLTTMMAAPKGEPDPAAMMAAGGPIAFENFRLRFEDASLTKRLLAYAAKLQGTDEAMLIANIGAMAQLALSQLRRPEFTQQAVTAITTFLKEPHSFTIAMNPAAPVQVQQLMSLDPADPGAAINLLGVSVSAND